MAVQVKQLKFRRRWLTDKSGCWWESSDQFFFYHIEDNHSGHTAYLNHKPLKSNIKTLDIAKEYCQKHLEKCVLNLLNKN